MERRGVVTIEAKIEDIISFVGEKIEEMFFIFLYRKNFTFYSVIGLNLLCYYFWRVRHEMSSTTNIKKVSFHVSSNISMFDEDNSEQEINLIGE